MLGRLQRYEGALHIVQLRDFPRTDPEGGTAKDQHGAQAPPQGETSQAPQERGGSQESEESQDGSGDSSDNNNDAENGRPEGVLLLEYLARGSLHKVLCSIQQQNETIPNRVLWLMFQCCKPPGPFHVV